MLKIASKVNILSYNRQMPTFIALYLLTLFEYSFLQKILKFKYVLTYVSIVPFKHNFKLKLLKRI